MAFDDPPKDEPPRRRKITVRARKPPPPAPVLDAVYHGLPAPNVLARLLLYEFLARYEDMESFGWPAERMDAVHCWDEYIASQILQRLAVRLAGLAQLHQGHPAAGSGALVRALRHDTDCAATAPWSAVRAMLAHAPVPSCDLTETELELPHWRPPPKRAAPPPPEPIRPRQTRATTRLVEAVQSMEDTFDMDDIDEGMRRSRRAEQLAAKKRHDALRTQAERMLGPTPAPPPEEDDVDEGEPMHLETKFASLVRLCDLLSIPKGVPATSPLHAMVQPQIEDLPVHEKEARDALAELQASCDAELKALQKKAPSKKSPRHAHWKHEVRRLLTKREKLQATHEQTMQTAHAEKYVALRRASPRTGPLGKDRHGNEYWHVCPDAALCTAGALPPFSGHWSHTLVVYGKGYDASSTEPTWYGTCDPAVVDTLVTYLQHGTERQPTDDALVLLVRRLRSVRTYLAWAASVTEPVA